MAYEACSTCASFAYLVDARGRGQLQRGEGRGQHGAVFVYGWNGRPCGIKRQVIVAVLSRPTTCHRTEGRTAHLDCACCAPPAMACAQCAARMCAAAEKSGWSRVMAAAGGACCGLVLLLVLALATLPPSADRVRFFFFVWAGASLVSSDE